MAEPPVNPNTSIAAQRTALLNEESQIASMLSAVRTRLNNLAPISKLPTDILENIFAICVSWLYCSQKPKYRLAWTQVCRIWRQVSLDSARLWRCIDLSDSHLAREFLKRSKSSPISIISASPLKLYTDDLHPYAERLQSIDVFLFPDDMLDLFYSIGPNISNLTDLSLRIPPVSESLRLHIPLPRVRKLSLEAVALNWPSCTNLTHLSLRGMVSSFAPSISELYSILQKSPQLEHLRLENIDSLPSDDDDPSLTNLIPLNDLQELTIFSKDRVIMSLLTHISIPSTTRLRLRFQDLHSFLSLRIHYQHVSSNRNSEKPPFTSTLRLTRTGIHLLPHTPSPSTTPYPRPWSEDPHDILVSLLTNTSHAHSPPPPPTLFHHPAAFLSNHPSITTPATPSSSSSILPSLSISLTLPPISSPWPSPPITVTTLELSNDALTDISKPDLASFTQSIPTLTTIRVSLKNPIDSLLAVLGCTPHLHLHLHLHSETSVDANAIHDNKLPNLPNSCPRTVLHRGLVTRKPSCACCSAMELSAGWISFEKDNKGVWRQFDESALVKR